MAGQTVDIAGGISAFFTIEPAMAGTGFSDDTPHQRSTVNMRNPAKEMPYMSPLINRVKASREKGFTENFEIEPAAYMINVNTLKAYTPADVTIVNHYRFEGMSDPGDNNILYEIETSDGSKGTLVTPYGPDCPAHVAEFVTEIPRIDKTRGSMPVANQTC